MSQCSSTSCNSINGQTILRKNRIKIIRRGLINLSTCPPERSTIVMLSQLSERQMRWEAADWASMDYSRPRRLSALGMRSNFRYHCVDDEELTRSPFTGRQHEIPKVTRGKQKTIREICSFNNPTGDVIFHTASIGAIITFVHNEIVNSCMNCNGKYDRQLESKRKQADTQSKTHICSSHSRLTCIHVFFLIGLVFCIATSLESDMCSNEWRNEWNFIEFALIAHTQVLNRKKKMHVGNW